MPQSHSKISSSLRYQEGDQPVPGYTLVRRLGEGAMGVVWLAQTDSGFEQALKVLDLTQRGARKEWRGLRTVKQKKLRHGNLLTLNDYWLKDADGNIVPDNDETGPADSVTFAPPDPKRPKAPGLKNTTSRTMDQTADHRAATIAGGQSTTRGPATFAGGGTLVPADREEPEVNRGGRIVDDTVAGQFIMVPPAVQPRRPVQLIVAMELGHKTLDDRKRQCQEERLPGIPVEELLTYMHHAARGLDYLHREDIIHRDIKPQNIMLVGDVAKVCDYGLVVAADYDLTKTTNAFTPLYASPEAVANNPILSGRADQYSLAIAYIELCTGQLPYSSETAATVFAAKETGKYDLSRVRKSPVRAVLRRALSREASERFVSCGEFVRELDKAEHTRGAVRMALALAAVAVVVLVLLMGGSLAFRPVRDYLVSFFPHDETVPRPIITIPKSGPPSALMDAIRRHKEVLAASPSFAEAAKLLDKESPTLDSIEASLPVLPVSDDVKADVILLRGRLLAGDHDFGQLAKRLGDLEGLPRMPDAQRRIAQYLRLLAADQAWSSNPAKGQEVASLLADLLADPEALKGQLSAWEWQVLQDVQARHGSQEGKGREQLIAVARAARVKGDLAAAEVALDDLHQRLNDASDAAAPDHRRRAELERLHLDISWRFDAASAISDADWSDLQRLAGELNFPAQVAEGRQLAVLRLFLATRLDPQHISLDRPVIEAFAAVPWQRLDGAGLAPREEQKLSELRDALGKQVRELAGPIPAILIDRLPIIWQREEVLRLLMDRLKSRLDDRDDAQFKTAADEFDRLFEQLDLNAVVSVDAAVNKELGDLKIQVAQRSLRKYLTLDSGLESAETRKVILNSIDSLGSDGGSISPLARLLRIEVELAEDQANDGKFDSQQLTVHRRALQQMLSSSDPPTQELLDYARFLRLRVEVESPSSNRALQTGDRDVLLNWPEPAASSASWNTPRRTSQAIDLLVRLGDAALPIKDKNDIVRFQEITAEQIKSANEYFDKAHRLGYASPSFRGLFAVVRAAWSPQPIQAEQWNEIADWAAQALSDPASLKDLEQRNRAPLVHYVAAVAAARRADSAAQERNLAAVATFAGLLRDEQIFKDGAPSTRSDRGLMENIVLPGLQVPLPDRLSDDNRRNLATIWAAKGRLVERENSLVVLPAVRAPEHLDSYARAILAANEAYRKARELYEDVSYAAGYGRTLLELPREDFTIHLEEHFRVLSKLIDDYDPQGSSNDPSLLLVGGWVMYRRAYSTTDRDSQIKLFSESLRRQERIAELTEAFDPYRLRSVALSSAANTRVQAAFFTPIRSADETRNPNPDAKYTHLRRAVELASQAELDESRRLPEEALISKGNALEDLAYYCKLTENYERSVEAFKTAAGLYGPLRSNAYALTCKGRCEFRWAQDALEIEADPDMRKAKLPEARDTLASAVERASADDEPQVKAEAKWWLGFTLLESARNEQNIPARLALLDQARQEMAGAADLVQSIAKPHWVIYQSDSAQATLTLALSLSERATLPNLSRESLLNDAARRAEELLKLAQSQPDLIGPEQVRLVIGILAQARLALSGRPAALRALQEHAPLLTTSTDAGRAALVSIHLWMADYHEGEQAAREQLAMAERIANQITEARAKERALGFCARHRADQMYKTRLASKQTNLSDAAWDEVLALYVQAEKHLAKALDPKTSANLSALKGAKLLDIEAGNFEQKLQLSNLEKHRLREFIRELDRAPAIRNHAAAILSARVVKFTNVLLSANMPLPPEAVAIARPLHDFLKPFTFMGKDVPLDIRRLVEALERKLL